MYITYIILNGAQRGARNFKNFEVLGSESEIYSFRVQLLIEIFNDYVLQELILQILVYVCWNLGT